MKHPSADPLPRGGRRLHVRRRESGFALLLTVTLLAFLVLILVALASLTRVETQVAGNAQHLAQARQNALLALNIALGQLQKYAGPDQRVTGTADLAGGDNGVRLGAGSTPSATTGAFKYWWDEPPASNGNGLTAVRAGTRHWMGVWGNADTTTPTAGNGNIYEKTPRPVLLNWLVSGNESATFSWSPASSDFGQITSEGTGYAYRPDTTISGLDAITNTAQVVSATANKTIKIGNSGNAVLLVGPNSAGSVSRTLEGQTESATDRYVVAPLVAIKAQDGAGTGAEDVTSPTVGYYAYWISDEGVKSRINLVDRYAASNDTAGSAEARYRLKTASRAGAELLADFPASYQLWSQSTADNPELARALRLGQTPFLDTSSTLTAAKLGKYIHDLTTSSVGIATDTLRGGLRKDLTHYFELSSADWGSSPLAGQGIIPDDYSPTMATFAGTDQRIPKWDVAHSFYNLPSQSGNSLAGSSSDTLKVQPASATQVGITPVVVQMRLLLGVRPMAEPSSDGTLGVLANPLIVLGNPYSVALVCDGLDFRIKADTRLTSAGVLKIFTRGNPREIPVFWGGVLDGTVFSIPSFTLNPGECKVFSVRSKVMHGSPVPLAEGVDVATFNYVRRDHGWRGSTATLRQFRPTETSGNSSFIVEFSLPGSSEVLQQLGGINPNRVSGAYPSIAPMPNTNNDHPMALYAWEYNAPGNNSLPYSVSGIGNTKLRPFADFNPRAGYFRSTRASYFGAPYTQHFLISSDTPNLPPPDFSSNLLNPKWGRDWSNTGVSDVILFDLPRRVSGSPGDLPMISLGAMQHVNLTAEDIPASTELRAKYGSSTPPPPNPGHQPAYPFGNSYAPISLPRAATVSLLKDYFMNNEGTYTSAGVQNDFKYYDISYLLNAAIWDAYFFSTIPQSGSSTLPTSPRLALRTDTSAAPAVLRTGDAAAAYALINGAFNINSTSIDAWRTVLGGMKALPNLPSGASHTTSNAVFPRGLHQSIASTSSPTETTFEAYYAGYRELTDAQIDQLATAIVAQVRQRGPFTSIAHFVNRVLTPATTDTAGVGQAGTLQAAIDAAGINAFPDDDVVIPTIDDGGAGSAEARGRGTLTVYADGVAAGTPRALSRSTAIPGWLTQADILQAIGPLISARSDSFMIRTYGEVTNPVTGETTGSAWCEATIQRTPDYVVHRPVGSATATGNFPTESGSALTALNQSLGRGFRLIGFRWLTPDDI